MNKCYLLSLLSCLAIFFAGCNDQKSTTHTEQETADNAEAREDSIALAQSYALQNEITVEVYAALETEPIKASSTEDAADDPAIWLDKHNPEKSLVYGSNKAGGLAVYNLGGSEVDYYPLGKINNVDIIQDFSYLPDSSISILGCSNRTSQSVDLFKIEKSTGELTAIPLIDYQTDDKIDDIYGFCFAKFREDDFVILNGKNGWMQQFIISYTDHAISLTLAREIKFEGQVEGMVARNKNNQLFVGEENRGVWQLSIDPNKTDKQFIALSSKENNPYIAYDIEGLALSETEDHDLLVASSQGNFSYALFDLNNEADYLGSFKIGRGMHCDGAEETDGLEIVNMALGDQFPDGLLVVQDGFNYKNNEPQPQNFKYVSWGEVLNKINFPKTVE